MVVKYALAALFGFCILTASASVSAAPGYSDSQTACIDTCRKANACHGGPGAHDGSTRCKRCVADCTRAQNQKK
jgi:hypothetical protein